MATAAMDICTLCSSNSLPKARGFEATKDALNSYFKDAKDNWTNLPSGKKEVIWSVYKVSPSGLGKHFSLLFVCEDKAYSDSPGFTFELYYTKSSTRGSEYQVVPQTHFLTRRGSILGSIKGSAEAIMNLGLRCLVAFGDYDRVTHNCQDFCSQFAKKLGIKQPWTDAEKAKAAVGVGAIAIGVGALAYLLSDGKKKEDKR